MQSLWVLPVFAETLKQSAPFDCFLLENRFPFENSEFAERFLDNFARYSSPQSSTIVKSIQCPQAGSWEDGTRNIFFSTLMISMQSRAAELQHEDVGLPRNGVEPSIPPCLVADLQHYSRWGLALVPLAGCSCELLNSWLNGSNDSLNTLSFLA